MREYGKTCARVTKRGLVNVRGGSHLTISRATFVTLLKASATDLKHSRAASPSLLGENIESHPLPAASLLPPGLTFDGSHICGDSAGWYRLCTHLGRAGLKREERP